ncbi:MAG: hypothetical protein ACERKD_22445 [Prolixibacteraceae bacterium]
MNLPQVQNNTLQDFLNGEDIVRETAEQIRKDFEVFGLEITFSGKMDNVYLELHEQVKVQVEYLLAGSSDRLYALLYRIDISDKAMVKASLELPHYSHVEVIAHQIILRDLQKVLTRRYFKKEAQK